MKGPVYIVYAYVHPTTGRRRRDARRYANVRGIIDRHVIDTLPPTVTHITYAAAVNKKDALQAVPDWDIRRGTPDWRGAR